jgi:uncharacterized protein DUF4440
MLGRRILAAIAAATALAQSDTNKADVRRYWNEEEATVLRAQMTFAYETSWNSHQPAQAVTPDRCADDAIFLNTTGGWVVGCKTFSDMISQLHSADGPFHDHTRRHEVEDLRFIRPDVALAVVKTFDIKRGGVATTGEETRGLAVFCKEGGQWKVIAISNTRIQAEPVGNR